MNLQTALTWGADRLAHRPEAALIARLLLQHALGVGHAYLLAHADDALPAPATAVYEALLARAACAEPLPYIIGRAPFRHLELEVTPAVLIPRPETELLVEAALRWGAGRTGLRAVDVGTGSGCIAVSLAVERPDWQVSAVDCSPAALAVARRNAQRYRAGVDFLEGDLLAPVAQPVDLIAANLPYIADDEWRDLDDGVKLHEPVLALRGGPDGLDPLRRLLQQAVHRLRPGGALFLEIGRRQGATTAAAVRGAFPTMRVDLLTDWSGHDRLVRAVPAPLSDERQAC